MLLTSHGLTTHCLKKLCKRGKKNKKRRRRKNEREKERKTLLYENFLAAFQMCHQHISWNNGFTRITLYSFTSCLSSMLSPCNEGMLPPPWKRKMWLKSQVKWQNYEFVKFNDCVTLQMSICVRMYVWL